MLILNGTYSISEEYFDYRFLNKPRKNSRYYRNDNSNNSGVYARSDCQAVDLFFDTLDFVIDLFIRNPVKCLALFSAHLHYFRFSATYLPVNLKIPFRILSSFTVGVSFTIMLANPIRAK